MMDLDAMRTPTALLLVSAALLGCSSGGESRPAEPETRPGTTTAPTTTPPPPTTEAEGEIELVPIPAAALARCRAGKRVAPACPERIPDSRWEERPGWESTRGSFPRRGAFELNAGAEHPGEPELDRPPRFVHLVVLGGREAARLDFRWPTTVASDGARDGLYGEPRRRALLLDRPTWGGRSGALVLAPSFEMKGGIVGNHLIFRWRDSSGFHAVSLHGWEPFTETVDVLQAVAESLPES